MIFVQKPLVDALYRKMDKKNWGVVRSMRLPRWASTIASILLLDYSLYLWHVLTHRLPLLWRFHQVHHIDKDLDASTALRFHFGELLLSVPWRLLQICLIGPSRKSFQLWQSLLMSSVLFHHSNIRLAPRIERLVAWLIMTPSLHGIHHSQRKDEMDTNWSSGLTLWDRLHGTFKGKSLKAEVDIGVEGYSGPHTLIPVLRLPFSKKHKVGA